MPSASAGPEGYGTVVASSDIGTFDAAGKKLTINESQLPSEMKRLIKVDMQIQKIIIHQESIPKGVVR
ncbi:hypothetical protein [Aeromonas veronii]|uniref:hypothetical protein n=1 Tax=Aeromonas veronii TaxID=654 RepID=UPI003D1C91DB